jgi:UDP-N-acetylmuramoyl-tripeptide--D-alanyl-D-alanine ligase
MMSGIWNHSEIAAALGVAPRAAFEASSVSIDSRTLAAGALFIAIKGDRMDGHAYVQAAFEAGAVAAIVEVAFATAHPDDARLIAVPDTQQALVQLGIAARARSSARFVGVTGSVGKTGCKEMLKHMLAVHGDVYATKGNLNNHLGVPLTLANLPRDVAFAVIEMGMNHAGEIAQLSSWARPDISIITTVDAVHLEFFDSVEAIADAKSEIFSGMQGAGVALIYADSPYCMRMCEHAQNADLDRIMLFGSASEAVCQLREYHIEGLQSVVDAVIAGTRLRYRIGAIGKHWGMMSVAALGIADALHLDLAKSAESLAYFQEPEGRGRIEEILVAGGHLRLIDDSYNASPVAMQAAFEKMAALAEDTAPPRPRLLAVLGDMLELGDKARDLHVGLVPTLVNNQIDLVFAAGSLMKYLYDALPEEMRGDYDETALGLAPKVVSRLQAGDLVLVKGSHGSRMRDVVAAIRDNAEKRG